MVKFEKAVLEGKSRCALPSGNESGTGRSIRAVCSAFQRRGNQQAGMSENFKAYQDEIGSQLQLVQMRETVSMLCSIMEGLCTIIYSTF